MDLKDRTVLITGSTDGVGRVVAQRLGEAGAASWCTAATAARRAASLSAYRPSRRQGRLLVADLCSLAEVRRLADSVRAGPDRLDILINNAGIGTGAAAERQTSADGYELRFAVNYLAGFLLTALLLPLLRPARRRASSTWPRPASRRSTSTTSC